jgi:hypothetical protein
MKIDFFKKHDESFNEYHVMQIPISNNLIQDCYGYYAIDSPSESKLLFLEEAAKAYDELVIKESPNHVDKYLLMDKLSRIEIKYKDAR